MDSVDAAQQTIIVMGLAPGPHHILVELADPTYHVLARRTVNIVVPELAHVGSGVQSVGPARKSKSSWLAVLHALVDCLLLRQATCNAAVKALA